MKKLIPYLFAAALLVAFSTAISQPTQCVGNCNTHPIHPTPTHPTPIHEEHPPHPLPPEQPSTPTTSQTSTQGSTNNNGKSGGCFKKTWVLDKTLDYSDGQVSSYMNYYHYQTYSVCGCYGHTLPRCYTKNYKHITKVEKINWIG